MLKKKYFIPLQDYWIMVNVVGNSKLLSCLPFLGAMANLLSIFFYFRAYVIFTYSVFLTLLFFTFPLLHCTAHYFNAALLTLPSYIVCFLLCFFPYFCITLCNSTRFVSCSKSENVPGHTFYFTSFFFTCLIPFSLSCSIPCQSLVSIA